MSLDGKGWFESIKSTPLKDRIFVLMLFFIFIAVGYSVYITKTLTNEKDKEYDLRIKAERELAIQYSINLKDNKDYTALLLQANKDCDEKWQIKLDNERSIGQKYLQEKAASLEKELNYLRNESRKIRSEAKTIKNKVNL